ncbi:ribonuclease E/G [Frisingicoccus sp.]|uniref:ribonuclease E/G n=1 Tax=Frisingicoccus sp. TaxID=1918627 RepID=UPI003AB423FA
MKRNMSKEVVITNYKNQYLVVSMDNGKAVEMFLKAPDALEIGDIFIGKVKNIVNNIQAAFVEIQPGVIGYYSLKSNPHHLFSSLSNGKLKNGDEILVQVERGNIKSKAPVLTSKIQLTGKHLVFLGNQKFIGISKKINDVRRRDALKEMGKRLTAGTDNGVIFRTGSAGKDDAQLQEEYQSLLVNYKNIMSIYRSRTCFSKILASPRNWLNYVHAVSEPSLRVLTDIPEVYREISNQYTGAAEKPLCELYTDISYPLIKLKSLETQISRALSKNVWLKSGASLVIETTEALTSIDVNTSKTEIHKNNEETFLQINMEAAGEICRQLRLRNLSGIIIIDFINLSSKEAEEKLMSELRKLSREDSVQLNLIDMTPLGLVEMTRKRTYRPLYEQMKEAGYFE